MENERGSENENVNVNENLIETYECVWCAEMNATITGECTFDNPGFGYCPDCKGVFAVISQKSIDEILSRK